MSSDRGHEADIEPYAEPAGGWGSLRSVESILWREGMLARGNPVLLNQNKPDGFMFVSRARAKPAEPLPFEYREDGAKATAWELTGARATPDFFAAHTLAGIGRKEV